MDELLLRPSRPGPASHDGLILSQQSPHSPSHPLSPPSPTAAEPLCASRRSASAATIAASSASDNDRLELQLQAPSTFLSSLSSAAQHQPSPSTSPPSSSPRPFSTPSSSTSSAALSAAQSLSPELPIPLYRYQVAGHSLLLSHAGTVCKPLIPTEQRFYCLLQSQLPCLMPFVPKYYGVLDPSRLDEKTRRELLWGDNNTRADRDRQQEQQQTAAAAAADSGAAASSSAEAAVSASGSLSRSSSASTGSESVWSSSMLSQRQAEASASQQWIVIEDLTFAYSHPCIMDLKLGKRQHGLYDSADKIASKQRKCALTTSAPLGLRLCGMQLWTGSQWLMKDKFDGRQLDVAAFMSVLHQFFSGADGGGLRLGVMSAMLARLALFRTTLSQIRHWKFFSSSLLMVYEGEMASAAAATAGEQDAASPRPPSSPSLSAELSSSAEAAISPLLGSLSSYSPDFLSHTLRMLHARYESSTSFSLRSSLAALQSPAINPILLPAALPSSLSPAPKSSKQLFVASSGNGGGGGGLPSSSSAALLSSSAPSSSHPSPLLPGLYTKRRKTTHAQARERSRERGNVDVRMIDFAHTARVGDGDDDDSSLSASAAAGGEEEEGLLFGFDTLIDAIARMMDEEVQSRKAADSSRPVQMQL